MRRYAFPVLMGIVGVAVLMSLGVWQLRRMEEKRVYLDEIEARIGNAPIPLPAAPEEGRDKFQAVVAEGRFTGEYLEVLAGQKGASPGVLVIEAFDLGGGRRIMVQRGFIEDDLRSVPRAPHEARVEGNLHWPQDTNSFTPPPDERAGLWFARDVPAMARKLGTEPTLIVAREPTGDGIAPVPVDTSGIPNDHWGYAIQWFLLAATWAGMTGFLLWRIRTRNV
ncbi:SURF1 family protein [Rhodobacter calidifons]|uniref:SURF1-like protein n=1 Tax=Rhodobacter calidifons TaxID=2715277 RepID=A0ABX0G7A0_9RHOB|nr:SURF1 family protein [Rhodobacter calidifons]NHB77120.1 SURF1 family protein [Rhodobacter calidifons]